jgi:hypothetical protein
LVHAEEGAMSRPSVRRSLRPGIERLEGREVPAVAFSFTLSPENGGFAAFPGMMANLQAAGAKVGSQLVGRGVLDVIVKVDNSRPRAGGAEMSIYPVGTSADGRTIYEQGTVREARTGVDPNGADPDLQVLMNTVDYLPMYLPQGSTAVVQALVDVLAHEIVHTIGFNGYRQRESATGEFFPFNAKTRFDEMTAFGTGPTASILFFTGPMARAQYGGPVPLTSVGPSHFLTSQNFYHVGNPSGVGSEPLLVNDLMNGIVFNPNFRYDILSPLDRAMLQDLGWEVAVPTTPLPVRYAVGAGTGSTMVRVFGPNGTLLFRFSAYERSVRGGVRVATGDVTGDGVKDIVTAPGPGSAPTVRVFDGRDGRRVASFPAYDPGFTGGVFVAVGDVNRDGRADIVTGPDAGGEPVVKVFSGANLATTLWSFDAFASGFQGGVRVAAGDSTGDGYADLIAAAGPGGGNAVAVFNGRTGASVSSFAAYPAAVSGGVFVGAGDTDGDGRLEIITGAGVAGQQVRVFNSSGSLLRGFKTRGQGTGTGVRVALTDTNGDNRAEIVTGLGPGGRPVVNIRHGVTLVDLGSLNVFAPGFSGGLFVG